MFAVIHKAMPNLISLTARAEAYRKKMAVHKSIYEAISARDSREARKRMLDHLTSTLKHFIATRRRQNRSEPGGIPDGLHAAIARR